MHSMASSSCSSQPVSSPSWLAGWHGVLNTTCRVHRLNHLWLDEMKRGWHGTIPIRICNPLYVGIMLMAWWSEKMTLVRVFYSVRIFFYWDSFYYHDQCIKHTDIKMDTSVLVLPDYITSKNAYWVLRVVKQQVETVLYLFSW